jgi:hypothetical protein
MLRYEMGSYFLRAAPRGIAEGTLALLLVLVPRVSSQFLGSSILFVAIVAAILFPEILAIVFGIQGASWILILLNVFGH